MSKEDDIKFLKIQNCVLRVNIHCDGCKQKVKKLLHKIDGVYTTTIDSEVGKVTVSGNVDPATLIRKLVKAGKHAELWSGVAVKGGNIGNNNQQLLNHQYQNLQQLDNNKGQKGGKPPKGPGGKDQLKNIPLLPQQLKPGGGAFKDLKLPNLKDLKIPFNKDQKKVKFADSLDQDDDLSDEFDDEFDDEELDEFDDDFDDDDAIKPHPFHGVPMKPLPMNGQVPPMQQGGHPFINAPPVNISGHGGGGGGGNGNKNVQVPIKVGGSSNDGSGKKGGGNNGGVNHNQNANQNQNGSGAKHGGKNGGGNNKNVPIHNGGAGGSNHHPQEPKKAAGGGGGGGVSQKGGPGQSTGFHEIDLRRNGGHGGVAGGPPGQMGYPSMPPAGNGVAGGPPGQMGYPGMPAAQGMPMNAGGFYRPEMMSAAAGGGGNPYQQQMMAQMMMQQQQRHNTGLQPMTYGRPPAAVAYAPPYMPPAHYCPPTPEYTHYFSDENTSSCSVM